MNILYITHSLNGLLMIAVPIILAVILTRRFKLGWRLVFIGAVTFIISQVGHIPFNAGLTLLFQRGILPTVPPEWRLPFNAVVLGLSAGLWEELTRAGVYGFWARDARSWRKGVLFGAGHGGMESIILGALVLFGFVQMLALQGVDLSTLPVSADQLAAVQKQVAEYWNMPWYMTLLGAVERMLTIPIQITFAVIVLQAFTRKQWWWVGLAILWHALIDAVAVYISQSWSVFSWGSLATEGVIAVFTLLSLGILFALRQPEPAEPPAVEPPLPPLDSFLPSEGVPEENPDKLDNTRFN